MLAEGAQENNTQFHSLASIFREHNVPVPDIHACDVQRGYFLVEDVGHQSFEDVYATQNANVAVHRALAVLWRIQQVNPRLVPEYEVSRFKMELGIFAEWCCSELVDMDTKPLHDIEPWLLGQIQEQPTVTVHRDYHCRNLLWRDEPDIGVVDFQDALAGPHAYDLASLLYDCYWEFSEEDVAMFADRFLVLKSSTSGTDNPNQLDELLRDTRLCAIQRQLKAVGIFARLWYQQDKATHLPYIVPVLQRVKTLCNHFYQLENLGFWLEELVIPNVERSIAQLKAS